MSRSPARWLLAQRHSLPGRPGADLLKNRNTSQVARASLRSGCMSQRGHTRPYYWWRWRHALAAVVWLRHLVSFGYYMCWLPTCAADMHVGISSPLASAIRCRCVSSIYAAGVCQVSRGLCGVAFPLFTVAVLPRPCNHSSSFGIPGSRKTKKIGWT